ncbi:hypothetical protein MNBD_UNCLBAC01-1565 [hydrothermal vent metagenome]|uniref:Uncharacterized protein n=1 Tax=hydrothermal vent metagenome TaxID=652676 RepID=A0A3B1DPU6_9ZZZZ
MGEKTILILLVLFSGLGVLTYSRYLENRQEISPAGKLVDFAGLSQIKDPLGPQQHTSQKTVSFKLENSLDLLKEKYTQIEAQRTKLVGNREILIEQILSMNGQLEGEAAKYLKILENERQRVFTEISFLNQFRNDIAALENETDPEVQQQQYEVIKGQLFDVLGSIVPNPNETLPEVVGILEDIDQVFEDGIGGDLGACEIISECLVPKLDDLEEKLIDFVNQPNEDIDRLLDVAKKLDGEYKDRILNFIEEADTLQEDVESTESAFKQMIEQLVKGTQDDLKDLIYLYQGLEADHQMLADYMEAEHEQWQQQHKDSVRNMDEKMKKIRNVYKVDFKRLKEKYRDVDRQRKEMMRQVRSKEDNLRRLTDQRFAESRRFVERISTTINVDIKRLVRDQQYARDKQTSYIRDRLAMQKSMMESLQRSADTGKLTTEIKLNLNRPQKLRQPEPLRRFGQ